MAAIHYFFRHPVAEQVREEGREEGPPGRSRHPGRGPVRRLTGRSAGPVRELWRDEVFDRGRSGP